MWYILVKRGYGAVSLLAASDEDQQQGPGLNQAAWKTILELKLSTVLYKIRILLQYNQNN
jgi:hypothetical protein